MASFALRARPSSRLFTASMAWQLALPLIITALLCSTLLATPAFALKCGETEPASTHADLEAEATGQRASTAADALADAELACRSALMAKASTLAGPVSCDSSDCWFWEGCHGTRTFSVPKISYDRDWAKYDYGRSTIQPCDTTSVLSGIFGCAARTVRVTLKCKGTVQVQKRCGGCAMCPDKGGDVYPPSTTMLSVATTGSTTTQPTEMELLCKTYDNDEAKVADAIISTME